MKGLTLTLSGVLTYYVHSEFYIDLYIANANLS